METERNLAREQTDKNKIPWWH